MRTPERLLGSTAAARRPTRIVVKINVAIGSCSRLPFHNLRTRNPFNYIDYKSYGVCGQSRGEVQWILRKRISLRRPRSIRQVKVCFKYYDGLTGVLRAVSPSLLVFMNPDQASESTESAPSSPDPEHSIRRPLRAEATVRPHIEPNEFIITDIQCRQLRKSRTVHSQYYSKLVYAPMSYKTKFCTNSVAPEWHDLNFVFSIDRTRELSLFIKEKTWAGSSVVGHVNVSVGYLLDQHRTVNCIHDTRQFAFVLRPATKNGQRKSSVCGIFSGQMLLSVKFRGEAIGERSIVELGEGSRLLCGAVTRLGKGRPQTTAMRTGDRGDIRATTLFGNCHFVSAPGLTKFRED
uniref:C2 domain-containing protein n=1 Tax=Plectus sambesii TaxID=2011161 RepID=A0A914UW24_9BILA